MTIALNQFNDARFRRQVDAALSVVKNILDTTRTPRYASEEDHAYEDKFGLAEFLTNTAIAAQMNVLEGLGMDGSKLRELQKIAEVDKRSVTLRFSAEKTCEFVKERVVEVERKHQCVTEAEESKKKGGANAKETTTSVKHKVITKVTEYHWRVGLEYVLYAYGGSNPEADAVVFQRRTSFADIITMGNKEAPLPSKARSLPIDTSLTWILENVSSDELACRFTIDRTAETCRTPRRNEDIADALTFFAGMKNWAEKVRDCLVGDVERKIILGTNSGNAPPSAEPGARVYIHSITGEDLFVPVLPLFENREASQTNNASSGGDDGSVSESRSPALVSPSSWNRSPLLSIADINLFLNEQRRSLDEKVSKINQFFPSKDSERMVSAAEAIIVLLALHTKSIADHFEDGAGYIENMLKTQLIKAIGKEIQASDFAEFVRFHDQKLLKEVYAPKPFCYAIRRPDHYPDGVLSIEKLDDGDNNPIMSITRKLDGEASPMFFPINAATSVEFTGDRYLHAWVSHSFAGRQEESFKLVARARQFSSFILLVGKISGPNSFEPQAAIILQNKDEVLIPLLLNQLPTPKEFKDAISSLSPEQKRFATAFRNMQLESSVFAVCCIQLKPQLEALLGLPADALTKEIRLTQDLLSLFIDYQVPSDLLSFDGRIDMPVTEKVGVVKGHVESVLKVIESAKDRDLQATQKEADMTFELKQAASPFGSVPAPAPASSLEHAHIGALPPAAKFRCAAAAAGGSGGKYVPPSRRGAGGGGGLGGGPPGGGPGGPISPQMEIGRALTRGVTPNDDNYTVISGLTMDQTIMRGGGSGGGGLSRRCDRGESGRGYDGRRGARYEGGGSRWGGRGGGRMGGRGEMGGGGGYGGRGGMGGSGSDRYGDRDRRGGGEISDLCGEAEATAPPGELGLVDFTRIPKKLDSKFEELDDDNALCATVIKAGDVWTKRFQRNLLAKPEETVLMKRAQKTERDKAFDLLDALSRSGSLRVECAELHVIVAATHNFDHSLMETVIQDNINPIEKMEKSTLIVASTIHNVHPEQLLKNELQVSRVKNYSPVLFALEGPTTED